jgi:vacuole morphology and inheritance protein 14
MWFLSSFYETELTRSDFRSVQTRHEKARRQQHAGDSHFMSSMHQSSPSQTLASAPNSAPLQAAAIISGGPKSSTLRRKIGAGYGSGPGILKSTDSGSGGGGSLRQAGLSPLNPKRGSGGIVAGLSIGGAVASMNGAAGLGNMRSLSPPLTGVGRKRVTGGLRRMGGSGSAGGGTS